MITEQAKHRPKRPISLTALVLGLVGFIPCLAETPGDVRQRLEQYRQADAETERSNAQRAVEAVQRQQRTLQWQERRKYEMYARRWKRYGDLEIDVLQWRQEKDGTWVTNSKIAPPATTDAANQQQALVRLGDTVFKIAQRYGLTLSELLRLNPEIEASHLVVGTPIRLHSQSHSATLPIVFCPRSDGYTSRTEPPLHAAETNQLKVSELKSCRDAMGQGARISTAESDTTKASENPSDKLIAINCASLMINHKPPYESWGRWARPEQNSPNEQLVIDRCGTAG